MSKNSFLIGAGVVGLGLLAGAVYAIGGIEKISIGQVGIVKHMDGEVSELSQGWHWVGWTVGVQEYPTYMQSLVLNDKAAWGIGTADQQELNVDTSLTWKIGTKNVTALYQAVGGKDIDYVRDSIVLPTMKNVVNQVTHKYGWNDIKGAKQAQVTAEINEQLKTQLGNAGIELGTFGFTSVGSPAGMADSQKALASAELGKQQATANQQKQQIENETAIAKAKADAEVKKIEAQATQQQAQALNELVIQKMWVEKWDGKLPNYQMGNSTPMINIPSGK
jgi:regulator of protease activity HflC (stomatin/prohibitin superfamily)